MKQNGKQKHRRERKEQREGKGRNKGKASISRRESGEKNIYGLAPTVMEGAPAGDGVRRMLGSCN